MDRVGTFSSTPGAGSDRVDELLDVLREAGYETELIEEKSESTDLTWSFHAVSKPEEDD